MLARLLLHFIPPIVASTLVIAFIDIAPQKNSRFGRYVQWVMTRQIEGLRVLGDIVTAFGAWYRSWLVIAVGSLIVAGAWLSGLVYAPRSTTL